MGRVRIFHKRVYRDPFGEPIMPDVTPRLTGEQQSAVRSVIGAMAGGFSTHLLTGVTGSGKTEVYLRLSAEAINRGRSVLVLVPEIALMSQMERRFRARFGDRIAVLHSGLSAGERFDQWTQVMKHEAKIVIGARSAIFAPLKHVGLIIVDEEHDTSYKQESGLRYNARDLAVMRAKLDGGIALLGSATPSIQSYFNVREKKFTELSLRRRVDDRPLPEITVVDLSENRDAEGIRRFITPTLLESMKLALQRREQILLFLNRRGYAGVSVCVRCGEPMRCKHCDITMTLHKDTNAYRCHYCGFTRASASACTACGSTRIKPLGLGTEKIEAAVKQFFPTANVARMDRDTTARKGAILKILKRLWDGKIDILIGTQIIAKGHDFPNITLVGIICADLSLNFPDFRSGERTFQILAQVAGRSGRGDIPGRVILQTYNPNHFCITAAKNQDFRDFYEREIRYRKSLGYPPYSKIIQLEISGKDRDQAFRHARDIAEKCREARARCQSDSASVVILGPIEAPLARIAGRYRWQMIFKGSTVKPVHGFIRRLMREHPALFRHRQVRVVVDVDPFSMM
jgi:primosomal protein N' (replication factor Y) (superfamily II helicase)